MSISSLQGHAGISERFWTGFRGPSQKVTSIWGERDFLKNWVHDVGTLWAVPYYVDIQRLRFPESDPEGTGPTSRNNGHQSRTEG